MQVVANINFTDVETGRWRCRGEKWEVAQERALELCSAFHKGIPVCSITSGTIPEKKGKRIIFFQNYLYKIGGIETLMLTLAEMFPDENVLFLYGNGFPEPLIELAKVWEVERFDRTKHYDCDILILNNHDGADIALQYIKAKKAYQFAHADYSDKHWFRDFKYDERVQPVAVSEQAKRGLKEAFNVDSVVCENPVIPVKKPLVLLTLSRASTEKGFSRMWELAKKMRDKNYIWLVATELADGINMTADGQAIRKMQNDPHFMFMPAKIMAKKLTTIVDYVVQLSDTESFCYSAYEALLTGTPVILTDFPQAFNVVDEGVNGYILKRDLSNADEVIKKMFKKIPKGFTKPAIKTKWDKLMKGEL